MAERRPNGASDPWPCNECGSFTVDLRNCPSTSRNKDSARALVARLLRVAADDLELHEDEVGRLRARITTLLAERDQLLNHQREGLRAMYRRGYFAGRASAKAGHPVVTNPERRMRGEMGRLLR